MLYCPFCGKGTASGIGASHSNRSRCDHLAALSRHPRSSVKFRPSDNEYWCTGSRSLLIRPFYCPVCGRKLAVDNTEERFLARSPTELALLRTRARGIATLADALERFGTPDTEHGPAMDCLYPGGRRTVIGHRRALIYSGLAKTITVAIMELLDGRVVVKFYPKEK